MASRSLLALTLFLLCCISSPSVQAQFGPLSGLLRIQGILYCTPNGNILVNATSTPVFPDAVVQLQCGGNVVSTATTNGSGLFSMLLNPVEFLVSTVVSGCKLVVNTPLASCNVSLPSVGGLVSDLQFVGNTLMGFFNIGNLIPSGFQFHANAN